MEYTQNVFDYILSEEKNYRSTPITVAEGWDWNMYDHVNLTVLYKNSTYKTGKDDNKPFKNITRPILNLQYRAEGFDVKDIVLYVDDAENYYKSFLVRKFHHKWALENEMDTFIDDLVESYIDFGGVLVKNVNKTHPEVVPLPRIDFCDQTDILSGPICEKHFYSPDQLHDMETQGWDAQAINDVIRLADSYKKNPNSQDKQMPTPGKYIEVFELHGTLPTWWLQEDGQPGEEKSYDSQLQIVTFYKDTAGMKQGITLFSGKEKVSPYKFLARDKIYGRALGLGGGEELFEAQVWVNYDEIRIKNMLDHAAKQIFQTTDAAFANRNRTTDMQNGEIVITAPNTRIDPVNTTALNITLFERSVSEWEAHAKNIGGSTEALMGQRPSAQTSFRLQALLTQQAQYLHDYRKGKLAVFMNTIYRDWILPYFTRELLKGQKFLAELELEELQAVADSLVTCQANDFIKEKILSGQVIDPQQLDAYKQQVRQQFTKGGNKKFIEILKGELKDIPMDVDVDIANKQKDLSAMTDKITAIMKEIVAAPQILDDPRMARLFNQILEASGFSPIDFTEKPPPAQQQNKVSESINFKDLPPEGQVQMAGQAGLKISPPQPQLPQSQPALVGAGQPIQK